MCAPADEAHRSAETHGFICAGVEVFVLAGSVQSRSSLLLFPSLKLWFTKHLTL